MLSITCGIWFLIKQTIMIESKPLIPLLFFVCDCFIIKQSQTKTVMTISCAYPSTVLLENGSMVHNQTNADRLRKLSVTFLENV